MVLGVVCYAEDPGYKVSGVNHSTGEMVAGQIFERDKNGTVSGVIRDRFDIVPVSGYWSGKGMAEVHGNGCMYDLVVID